MKRIVTLALAVLMIAGCALSFASCSKYEMKFGKDFSALDTQMDVLLQLNAKSIDVGVMDSVMAGYYMSQNTQYASSLMIVEGLVLATEQYGIAARKGSGFTKKINQALIDLAKDGTVDTIADKYGLKSEICIDKDAEVKALTEAEMEDWNYIVGQGKFIVGYTEFAPIAFEDESTGELVGFDIELAKAVAAKLGLTVEFKIIDWDTKEAELKSKTVDCIWNGMTITAKRQAEMEVSIPYMNNKQVAVIRKEDKDLYKTLEDMKKALLGAEDGSAGMECCVVVEKE